MLLLHALILGILQGATEFFPISSSAHLKIAKFFLGIEHAEGQVIFDLLCHLGTLCALLVFLRKELLQIKKEQLNGLFLALLPLIPAYFLLKPLRDWASKIHFLGFFLIVTAFILFCGEKLRIARIKKETLADRILIGTAQSLALIPGISRSASTISCARMLGFSAKEAVRFSFLLAIPTIIGGNCLELFKISLSQEPIGEFSVSSCMIGFCASFFVGMVTVPLGFKLLERGYFKPFAWYCLILGTLLSVHFYG